MRMHVNQARHDPGRGEVDHLVPRSVALFNGLDLAVLDN